MPTGLHCLLVCGIHYWLENIVTCRKPGMASCVTEAQSHDEGRGGRSVTARSARECNGGKNKSVIGAMETQQMGTENVSQKMGYS